MEEMVKTVKAKKRCVIGIDLAGSQKRRTGFCVLWLHNNKVETSNLFLFRDIVNACKRIARKAKVLVIAIDAPLSLPYGRTSLSKKEKSKGHFRKCDLMLRKLGIRFFPITLGPMRKLTLRGIKLKQSLTRMGFNVIETYPGAVQDLLNIPRKQHGIKKLREALTKLGINNIKVTATHDELDAITCAWLAKLYVEGKAKCIGDKREGLMVIPKAIGVKNKS